jgi:hypothetical protein
MLNKHFNFPTGLDFIQAGFLLPESVCFSIKRCEVGLEAVYFWD